MPIFGWIRDALGLHKDIIDSKKSTLEVEKLKDEKMERQILTRATLADVRKYDRKTQVLEERIRQSEGSNSVDRSKDKEELRILSQRGRRRRIILSFVKDYFPYALLGIFLGFCIFFVLVRLRLL